MDFGKKRNKDFFNKELLFKTLGVAVLLLVFVLLVANFKMYQKKQELNSQINAYQRQIEDIEKSSQTLKDEIANSDNIDYLEKLAYEQLNQQRPGEKEIIFVTPQKNLETAEQQKNFWDVRNWFASLFGWIKSIF